MTEPWKWSFLRFTWQWNRTISASVKSVKWSSCVISPNPSHCRQHARYMSASFHLKFGKLDLLSGVVDMFVLWEKMRRDSRQIGGSWTCTWLGTISYSGLNRGQRWMWRWVSEFLILSRVRQTSIEDHCCSEFPKMEGKQRISPKFPTHQFWIISKISNSKLGFNILKNLRLWSVKYSVDWPCTSSRSCICAWWGPHVWYTFLYLHIEYHTKIMLR